MACPCSLSPPSSTTAPNATPTPSFKHTPVGRMRLRIPTSYMTGRPHFSSLICSGHELRPRLFAQKLSRTGQPHLRLSPRGGVYIPRVS